jgi:hypothetical protein
VNLAALRTRFRSDIRDVETPQLFSDAEVNGWFNEALSEACLRSDLILEESDPAVCEIAVTAGQATYSLHEAITRIQYASFTPAASDDETEPKPIRLELIDRIELTRIRPEWRITSERPRDLIQDDKRIRLGCLPDVDGTLRLEAFRLPLELLAADNDVPEINGAHHLALVQWVLYRGYRRPDVETYSQAASDEALTEFERVFGPRPDADLRKDAEIVPQFNKIYFP